jgi:hypothetical protein
MSIYCTARKIKVKCVSAMSRSFRKTIAPNLKDGVGRPGARHYACLIVKNVCSESYLHLDERVVRDVCPKNSPQAETYSLGLNLESLLKLMGDVALLPYYYKHSVPIGVPLEATITPDIIAAFKMLVKSRYAESAKLLREQSRCWVKQHILTVADALVQAGEEQAPLSEQLELSACFVQLMSYYGDDPRSLIYNFPNHQTFLRVACEIALKRVLTEVFKYEYQELVRQQIRRASQLKSIRSRHKVERLIQHLYLLASIDTKILSALALTFHETLLPTLRLINLVVSILLASWKLREVPPHPPPRFIRPQIQAVAPNIAA